MRVDFPPIGVGIVARFVAQLEGIALNASAAVSEYCFYINKLEDDARRDKVADGVGFEPTVSLHPRRFSRPVP